MLANALVGLGLLSLDERGYACTPFSRRFLDEASSEYSGRVVRLGCWWWARWSELTQVVKTGVARDFVSDGIPLAGDPPGPYDLALLSSVVHLLGEEENIALLGRVHDALVPGGRVVIRDFLVDESGVEPLDAALFAITMLVTSRNGRCYSFGRMKDWLNGTGFGEVEQSDFDGPVALITARRA